MDTFFEVALRSRELIVKGVAIVGKWVFVVSLVDDRMAIHV